MTAETTSEDMARPTVEWVFAPGLSSNYVVSNLGRVRNATTNRLLVGEIGTDGYMAVNVVNADGAKTKRRVHVLVCEAFHGPRPEGCDAAHFDGSRLNNRADNLRWATRSENMKDAARHGTLAKGASHPRARLSVFQIDKIRRSERPHRALAREMGVGEAAIRKIRKGDRW